MRRRIMNVLFQQMRIKQIEHTQTHIIYIMKHYRIGQITIFLF